MGNIDVSSFQPSRESALVRFGRNIWNLLTGKHTYRETSQEKKVIREGQNILRTSRAERSRIIRPGTINTYTAGEQLSPQETAQKISRIFGNVESVRIPRSNGTIEVASRRADGLFYFAGKNTPCYLDKGETASKNIDQYSKNETIAGEVFYQNNVQNQTLKSEPNLQNLNTSHSLSKSHTHQNSHRKNISPDKISSGPFETFEIAGMSCTIVPPKNPKNRSDRNKNPLNIREIGFPVDSKGYSICPSYEIGITIAVKDLQKKLNGQSAAIRQYTREKYGVARNALYVRDIIGTWAPESDGNNPDGYTREVLSKMGFSGDLLKVPVSAVQNRVPELVARMAKMEGCQATFNFSSAGR